MGMALVLICACDVTTMNGRFVNWGMKLFETVLCSKSNCFYASNLVDMGPLSPMSVGGEVMNGSA